VFAYWIDGANQVTDNPWVVNMSADKSVTAKFFKTFRNAVGSFRKNVSDDGGECVDYVNYETDIQLSGYAYEWYRNAINAGYYVSSSTPVISSIIVFATQGNMTYGHVGIVTAINGNNITIRDSNWCNPVTCHEVKEHTVDISNYTIAGYIYFTPPN